MSVDDNLEGFECPSCEEHSYMTCIGATPHLIGDPKGLLYNCSKCGSTVSLNSIIKYACKND